MTNYADPVQSYVEGTDSKFSNMIATGSTTLTARYVAVVRDWLVLGNTNDTTDGVKIQRVWWSSINDPTSFPALGSTDAEAVQSDAQDLVGDFGQVQGIVGNLGNSHAAIFQERAVWRMNYEGPPTIFRFDIAEGVRGTPAPGSIAQLGAVVYFLGEDGFYAFDGATSRPVGFQKVDRTFDLDQTHIDRVTSTVDPFSKTIFWAYPGTGNINGTPNRIIVYNWALDRWSITAPGDIELEILLRSLSFGYTLETLDALYPNIDTMGISLDDRSLTGGKSFLAAFDTSHRLSSFTGPNLAATVDTAETQIFPGKRAFVSQTRPIVDGGTPSIAMGTRSLTTENVTFDTPVEMDADGWCPQRSEGRYHRARITMPAGSVFDHLEGFDVEAVPAGIR
jgi:hypothetical protein